jgi:hypothetical protein
VGVKVCVIVGVKVAVLVGVEVAAPIVTVAPAKGKLLKLTGCPLLPVPPVKLKE